MGMLKSLALIGIGVELGRKLEERTPVGSQRIFSIPGRDLKISVGIKRFFLTIPTSIITNWNSKDWEKTFILRIQKALHRSEKRTRVGTQICNPRPSRYISETAW